MAKGKASSGTRTGRKPHATAPRQQQRRPGDARPETSHTLRSRSSRRPQSRPRLAPRSLTGSCPARPCGRSRPPTTSRPARSPPTTDCPWTPRSTREHDPDTHRGRGRRGAGLRRRFVGLLLHPRGLRGTPTSLTVPPAGKAYRRSNRVRTGISPGTLAAAIQIGLSPADRCPLAPGRQLNLCTYQPPGATGPRPMRTAPRPRPSLDDI